MIRTFSTAAGAASFALLGLALSAPAAARDTFFEQDGIVIVEIESTPTVDDWLALTAFPNFTGHSYYKWDGPNHFSQPGNSVLTYQVHINNPGTYNLWIRNRHEDSDSTEENDCWTRMDDGQWNKTYSNGPGTVSQWNWVTQFELNGGALHQQASYDLSAGVHTFRISARSHGFYIDRFHLARPGHPDENVHQRPQSPCVLGTTYCASTANSTGIRAELEAVGSDVASDNDFVLVADSMPLHKFGYFIASQTSDFIANGGGSQGNICVGGSLVRFVNQMQSTGASGSFVLTPNLSNFPGPAGGQVLAGQTWYFQAWFRDGQTSNFTDALEVPFI